jgi:hypothetical protein
MAKDITIVGIVNALLQEGEQFPLKGAGKCLMVRGKDMLFFLNVFHDRSEFLQVFNMECGDLSEAAGIIQDDSGKVTAQLSGGLPVILTVSDKEYFIRFGLCQVLDVP